MSKLPQDPLLLQAYYQWQRQNLPTHLYKQYCSQFYNARSRGLGFSFTLSEWVAWWRDELEKKGENKHRGNQRGRYMMCRIGDQGGYHPGNVYCGTPIDNAQDRDKQAASASSRRWHATHESHLQGKRGDDHPKSRSVIDHNSVRHGSIALASETHNITRQAGFYRVQTGKWHYATLEDGSFNAIHIEIKDY